MELNSYRNHHMTHCFSGFIHILTSQIPGLSRTFQCQIQGPLQWIHKLLTRKDTPIFRKKCNDWILVYYMSKFQDFQGPLQKFQDFPDLESKCSKFSRTCANPVFVFWGNQWNTKLLWTFYVWVRTLPSLLVDGNKPGADEPKGGAAETK